MGQGSALKHVLSAFKRNNSRKTPGPSTAASGENVSQQNTKRLFSFSPTKSPTKLVEKQLRFDADAEEQAERIPAHAPAAAAADGSSCEEAEQNIKVIVRIRPRNSRETSLGGAICVHPGSASQVRLGPPAEPHLFTFDNVLGEATSQADVFAAAGRGLVDNCLRGFNGCMFAYGQTGAGKSFTMIGSHTDSDAVCPTTDEGRGLIQRSFEHLFATIQHQAAALPAGAISSTTVTCSFMELYNETISDLLCPGATGLTVREAGRRTFVEGLSEERVACVDDVVDMLRRGAANRRIGETLMNERSSRSHTVITVNVERRSAASAAHAPAVLRSRLHLVDLAGSERQKTSGAAGERLKEASAINKSLSALGLVIMNLVKKQQGQPTTHVPYRDSKLTHLLQDSLGGNARTVLVAAVSPAAVNALETLSTLRFADSAKRIRNRAVANEDAEGDADALRREIRRLKEELAAARGPGQLPASATTTPVKGLGMELGGLTPGGSHARGAGAGEGTRRALVGALRREAAGAARVAAVSEELNQMRGLVACKDADLQRLHMMLKLKESRLGRLAPGGSGESVDARVQELEAEVAVLRGRVEHHPQVKRFAVENLHLSQEVARLREEADCGEIAALREDVGALRGEVLALAAALEEAQDGMAVACADADAAHAVMQQAGAVGTQQEERSQGLAQADGVLQEQVQALTAANDELKLQLAGAEALKAEAAQLCAHAAGLETDGERLRAELAQLHQQHDAAEAVYRGTLEELATSWDDIAGLEVQLEQQQRTAAAAADQAAAERAQHEAALSSAASHLAGALHAAGAVQKALQARTAEVKELQQALEGAGEERDGLIEETLGLEKQLAGVEAQKQVQQARAEAAEEAVAALQAELAAAQTRVQELTGEVDAVTAVIATNEATIQGLTQDLDAALCQLGETNAELHTKSAAVKEAAGAAAAAQSAAEASAAEVKKLQSGLGQAVRRCVEAEEGLGSVEQAKAELEYELSEVQEHSASLQSALAASKADCERSVRRAEELAAKLETATSACQVAERERAALQARVLHLELEFEDARAAAEAARGGPLEREQQMILARAEAADARAQLKAAKERADSLAGVIKAKDDSLATLKADMAAEVNDAAQQVQQLLAAQARAEEAEGRAALLERQLAGSEGRAAGALRKSF